MTFWAYMLHCRGGAYHTGHTDDLERRVAQHQAGAVASFTAERLPVELVWAEAFATRDEAKAAEHRIKGWSRAKKMALIRGDFGEIARLARKVDETPSVLSVSKDRTAQACPEQERPFDKLRADGLGYDLVAHPTSVPSVRIRCCIAWQGPALQLTYIVTGDLSAVVVPPPAPSIRTDELWRATCFELFVQDDGTSYREFNFSPSGAWAAYSFDGYREGMRPAEQEDPSVDWNEGSLRVRLPIRLTAGERIGLSAVIERTNGDRLYFALKHPEGPPDFHDRSCFVATLPPSGEA